MRYERDGFSVEAAIKKKRPLPDWYLDEPPNAPGSAFFYEAFRDLQTTRHPEGPIPWDRAMAYAREKGLAPDLARALWIIVNRMDVTERKWRVEQLEAEAGGD